MALGSALIDWHEPSKPIAKASLTSRVGFVSGWQLQSYHPRAVSAALDVVADDGLEVDAQGQRRVRELAPFRAVADEDVVDDGHFAHLAVSLGARRGIDDQIRSRSADQKTPTFVWPLVLQRPLLSYLEFVCFETRHRKKNPRKTTEPRKKTHFVEKSVYRRGLPFIFHFDSDKTQKKIPQSFY